MFPAQIEWFYSCWLKECSVLRQQQQRMLVDWTEFSTRYTRYNEASKSPAAPDVQYLLYLSTYLETTAFGADQLCKLYDK